MRNNSTMPQHQHAIQFENQYWNVIPPHRPLECSYSLGISQPRPFHPWCAERAVCEPSTCGSRISRLVIEIKHEQKGQTNSGMMCKMIVTGWMRLQMIILCLKQTVFMHSYQLLLPLPWKRNWKFTCAVLRSGSFSAPFPTKQRRRVYSFSSIPLTFQKLTRHPNDDIGNGKALETSKIHDFSWQGKTK